MATKREDIEDLVKKTMEGRDIAASGSPDAPEGSEKFDPQYQSKSISRTATKAPGLPRPAG